MRIDGAVALVTGASSGIGAAVAVELSRRGAHVVAVARREHRLDEVVRRCEREGGRAQAAPGDVADRAACEALVTQTVDEHGRLDILVNNAGVSMRRHVAATTADEVERVVGINLLGPLYLAAAALPGMVERGRGSIINVTSVAGYVPTPRESVYGATKAGLSIWSHVAGIDLHESGVHVGVVSPGPIDTEIWEKDEEPAAYEGRLYPPEVVATAVAKSIKKERTHVTVPRRYGLVGALYPLTGRPMRWGLRRFQERGEQHIEVG